MASAHEYLYVCIFIATDMESEDVYSLPDVSTESYYNISHSYSKLV